MWGFISLPLGWSWKLVFTACTPPQRGLNILVDQQATKNLWVTVVLNSSTLTNILDPCSTPETILNFKFSLKLDPLILRYLQNIPQRMVNFFPVPWIIPRSSWKLLQVLWLILLVGFVLPVLVASHIIPGLLGHLFQRKKLKRFFSNYLPRNILSNFIELRKNRTSCQTC